MELSRFKFAAVQLSALRDVNRVGGDPETPADEKITKFAGQRRRFKMGGVGVNLYHETVTSTCTIRGTQHVLLWFL